MRSRLEADFAQHFLEPDEWQYEPQCYADETGQYLPDFWWPRMNSYVEVKPANLSWQGVFDAAENMRVIWASEPQANLEVVVWQYGGPAKLIVMAHGDNRIWRFWMPGFEFWGIWPHPDHVQRLTRSGMVTR
jgi:hypothetical protein